MTSPCQFAAIGLITLAVGLPAAADSATFTSDRDNTLYEDEFGLISNGAGPGFFVGRTASGKLRRGLLHFDVDSIPCGSTINSVELRLELTQAISGPEPIGLHRALADWGEGASVATGGAGGGGGGGTALAGDATWLHTFYDTSFWSTPGGDFVATPSATQTVDNVDGPFVWSSTPALVADVQQWVGDESSNNGWVLVTGFENISATAKRFATREAAASIRPRLVVDFTPPAPCPQDLDGNGTVGFADLNTLLGNWGDCSGCPGDLDCNGTVGFADLSNLLGAWGPCS